MTREEFICLREEAIKREGILLLAKGAEYHTNEDMMMNFNLIAEQTGLTPLQVWAIYFMKHVCSILSFVRTGRDSVEGTESRFDDAVNYLHLGLGLIEDKKHG